MIELARSPVRVRTDYRKEGMVARRDLADTPSMFMLMVIVTVCSLELMAQMTARLGIE